MPVTLDPAYHRFIGLHIGLRRTTGGLVDLAGNVVTERVITHKRSSQSSILAEARDLCEELTDLAGGAERVLGAGIATGGRVDPVTGTVLHHPLLDWHDVTPRATPSVRGPTRSSSTAASGRWRWPSPSSAWPGAPRPRCSSSSATSSAQACSSTAGCAEAATPRPGPSTTYRSGPPAPDRTCHCGRTDCLAVVASDVAVLARARAEGLVGPQSSFESVVRRSREGGTAAAGLLRERAEYAGVAAAILLDLLDPDVLVLGGGLLQAPEHLDALRRAAAGRLSRPEAAERIVPTGLGEGTLVRGSASLPMHAFFEDPVTMLRSIAVQP